MTDSENDGYVSRFIRLSIVSKESLQILPEASIARPDDQASQLGIVLTRRSAGSAEQTMPYDLAP
jgi:hypothetical protein